MRERLELSLPVRVYGRESEDYEWVEQTRLVDVTPFGVRLTLSRPTEPGRLLHLTLPMPRQLRCFDHVEDQYRVWALVRNLKTLEAVGDKPPRYEIGAAFIGKRPPTSFEKDPTILYEVAASVTETGLWGIAEREAARHVAVDKPRPETRHNIPIEVTIEVLDEKGQAPGKLGAGLLVSPRVRHVEHGFEGFDRRSGERLGGSNHGDPFDS